MSNPKKKSLKTTNNILTLSQIYTNIDL